MADVEFYIGKVVSNDVPFVGEADDQYCTGAILVRIPKDDARKIPTEKLPHCLPLLPMMLHVKPNVGEQVLVVVQNDGKAGEQRQYIGPIISQPQKIENDPFPGGTKYYSGGMGKPEKNPKNYEVADGALPKDSDIAIIGRKECDIILSEDELRIRCGVRLTDGKKIKFNKASPAYLKMKYYKGKDKDAGDIMSTATLVADRINLISPSGDFKSSIDLYDKEEGINDENMMKLIEEAHRLPYGDLLCEFLAEFMQVFLNHSHNGNNTPPTPGPQQVAFMRKYNPYKESLEEKLTSEVIRVN